MGSSSYWRELASIGVVLLGIGAVGTARAPRESAARAAPTEWVSDRARPGDFPLVSGGRAADVVYAAQDFKVVAIAAQHLAADVERVAANGRYENIYTLGMRGIHDSPIVGPKTDAERVQALEHVFADQRALLAKYINPDVTQVAQAFMPYKEVLPLYREGLRVPDDVTIVWPDDNFGYIRQLPTPAFRRLRGLLSHFLSRQPAGVHLALHDAARADLGGDEQGLRPRRQPPVDPERRRPQAGRDRHHVLHADGLGRPPLAPREPAGLPRRLGSAPVRPRACARDRGRHGRVLPPELPAEAGAPAVVVAEPAAPAQPLHAGGDPGTAGSVRPAPRAG